MVRAVVRSHKADEQVVVALGGDGKGEGLGQSLAEAKLPGSCLMGAFCDNKQQTSATFGLI